MRARDLVFAALLGVFLPGLAHAADVPYLSGRVVDNAEILSAAAREQVEQAIKAHEGTSTDQIAVLTVPSLEGESVEQFATKVFETWKLGQKDKDNGVLVLISPKDRRLRIEVGYGLEGKLPDVAASRIIRNVITPRFKENNYDRGVVDGVEAIVAQLEGRGSVPADGESAAQQGVAGINMDTPELAWPLRILLGAFIFGIIGLFTIIGVMTPGVGWFLYLFLIPFWAMFPIVIVGTRGALVLLIIYLIAYPVAKIILGRQPWYAKAARELKSKGTATIGGFTVSSGSSSGSSGSSSGGFSGGGGSSGGGGASGSW
ncbi:MAG: TPM domain-containing protein [Betaproteobacteria bacterium]|nr:TPM domain-containing protein [Betaproteobacteria bacterium]